MPKVLIVEDDPKLAEYFCNLLQKRKYEVSVCHNSKEFFAKYKHYSPDLLILDIKLKNSRLNGLEIYQELIDKNQLKKSKLDPC